MKKHNNGFTLIEIIIGVSISLILMISISVLVSSGMKNITIQKQFLDNSKPISHVLQSLNDIFLPEFEIIQNTQTSILLKSNYILGKPEYYYIGEKTSTGYCQNDLDIENKYLEIKAFNPFILTGTLYSGSYIQNVIYSGGQVIAGKGVFGDIFAQGSNGTGIYLNNPSGITSDSSGKLYISDSANNKILYMSGTKVYKLLDIDDGIFKPTGIFYTGGILYILNSGRKSLISLSSKNTSVNSLDLSFIPEDNISFNKIKIEILPDDFSINGTYNSGSFSFSGFSGFFGDSVSYSSNNIEYSFSGSVTFNSGSSYGIKINSFSGTIQNGNYYIKLSLYNSNSLVYEKYFYYLTNGDNDLTTMNDNVLNILTGSLDGYFSQIIGSGGNLVLNDYINSKYIEITSSGNLVGSGTLSYDINNFEKLELVKDFLIKDLTINKSGGLLSIKIDYYKSFSCFNPKDSIIKTILIKKEIPN